jgi:hypothetical protein
MQTEFLDITSIDFDATGQLLIRQANSSVIRNLKKDGSKMGHYIYRLQERM